MKTLVYIIMVILAALFDTSVLPNIVILGAAADITLCVAVSCSLLNSSFVGAMMGMAGGLLIDISVGSMLGFYGIQYLLVGYLAGKLPQKLKSNELFIPPITLILAYLIKTFILCVLLLVRGIGADIFTVIINYSLLGMVLSVVFMIIFHFFNRKIHNLRSIKTRYISDKEFDF